MDDIELELWIFGHAGREYQVSIPNSPFGVGTNRFEVAEDSPLLTDAEAGPPEGQRDVRLRKRAAQTALLELKEQGAELFRLAFGGENRKIFDQCRHAARTKQSWLRLQLTFHEAPAAADWPWEALVDASTGLFLANQQKIAFQRAIGLARSQVKPQAIADGSVHILLIGASPGDLTSLGVREEKAAIQAAFRKAHPKAKIHVATSQPTLDEAMAARQSYDIIHVISHGDFDGNEGAIWLEGDRGEAARLSSRELPGFLRHPASLVFLNCCHSGRSARDPFAGLAESLLHAGTPAVVAMRRAISDTGAIKLAKDFYQYLAGGETVALALARWRQQSSRKDADWSVPGLYLCNEDFSLVPAPESAAPVPVMRSFAPVQHGRFRRFARRKWLAVAAGVLISAATAGVFLVAFAADPPSQPPPAVPPDDRCPVLPGLDMPMVFIPAGTFLQGSVTGEPDERPPHSVKLTEDFCMAAFEATWSVHAQVMGGEAAPEKKWYPVDDRRWLDAHAFAERLEQMFPGAGFRLPTSAQWEYAARAGLAGDEPDSMVQPANCLRRGPGDPYLQAAPVGRFQKNAFGLYDMKGNVWEWVEDWEELRTAVTLTDPRGPPSGEKKLRRGGSYLSSIQNCRVSTLQAVDPVRKQSAAGFRIVRTPLP